jgi:predicted dehydrogenase
MDDMVAHSDIDLVVVCVRVPGHYDLVMKSLRAGKPTFCEWPLGANLKEAEEMADLARERSLRTIVGLQARSDPTLMYAHELIKDGYIGEVLAVHLSVLSSAQLERGSARVWQGQRKHGANTLTIAGGHALEAMCAVLWEFAEVSARVATRIKVWRNTDTGENVTVDSPDVINVAGRLANSALAAGGALSVGSDRLLATRGREPATELEVSDRFKLVPGNTPAGSPRNVGQAYTRFVDTMGDGEGFNPDFDLAVKRHRLIDAIERSSAEARAASSTRFRVRSCETPCASRRPTGAGTIRPAGPRLQTV